MMENSSAVAIAELCEKNAAGLSVKDNNVDLSLNGTKNTNGDDVFEVAEDETIGLVNVDLFHDFKGVIGAPGVVQSEISTSEEKQMGLEKVLTDEININGSAYDDMAENLNVGYEESEDSDRKPVEDKNHMIWGKMTFLEALTSGRARIPDEDSKEKTVIEISEDLEPSDDSAAIPSDIPENSLDHVSPAAADVLKEQTHETSRDNEDEDGAKESGSQSNGHISSLGYESDSADPHSEFEEAHEEESSTSCVELNDDSISEPKKLGFESMQVQKSDSQVIVLDENSGIPAPDASVTDKAEVSSGLNTNSQPALEEKEEVEPELSSSQSLPESSGSPSQPEISINTIKRGEEEGLKDENNELHLSGNTEQEVTHDIVSDHGTKVKEPVSQGTPPIIGKQEIKFPNSVTTQPASQTQTRVNGAISTQKNQLIEDPTSADAEEYDETREKLQMIRVKFLRLACRLGQTPHNMVVAQVLYRLGLAEQLHGRSRARVGSFSFDRASAMAEQLEAAGHEPLDFACTIMVIGKSGVGKSATINSIFDETMFGTDAFQSSTSKVQDIVGTVQGIRVRVIDTPGLLPSWSDQWQNEKTLRSVKKFITKTPPDIVLYLDRLDCHNRDSGDTLLLRTITKIFEPSIWFNAIVVLTHASSAPPEGPTGTATNYDMFVTQRSRVVQDTIRQAAGDMRLMNPVCLVENHSTCRKNRAGQRVLPNGQVWKPHLLLLSFASKILAEANTLLKLQDTTPAGRYFTPRTRPSVHYLLSSLLQSKPEIKLPSEQFEDGDVDDDLDGESDPEEESEYDELPPFKPLTTAQLENLSKAQSKAYYEELEYREKLFMKKQLREARKSRKLMKEMQEEAKDLTVDSIDDNNEQGSGGDASVPVPMPDLALPASFDSDNPTHRYRSLDSSSPWLVRAVPDPNGWDHDIGYDGVNIERLFVAKEKIPIFFSGHISKDKKDTNLQMEVASSIKHGRGKVTSLGFEMQPVEKGYAYTLRSESRLINHRISKMVAGLSATVLGDSITGGVKLEDKLRIGRWCQFVVSGGAIYGGSGESAYGGSLEATLRDKDNPLGRFLTTLGLSVMDRHGELAVGCVSQIQIPIGRHTNMIGRVNVNNRGNGQLSLKVNSSEQLQIVLVGLIPLVKKVFGYYYSPQAQ